MSKRKGTSQGQALVEFTLTAIAVLFFIFFIVEAGRIFWGWVTVQQAAREGARYAITGQFDGPDCAVADLPKFNGDRNNACFDENDLRPASVIAKSHAALGGLPLNEESFTYTDNFYYDIMVWGVDENGELRGTDMGFPYGPEPFAGVPSQPVTVRVVYRVPVITPLLRAITKSIPVVGQVTMNNEAFGQLGNTSKSQTIPPGLPAIPTAGPTPTWTPTPTETLIPTAGPTITRTPEPNESPTPTPTEEIETCPVRFEGNAFAGNNFVFVTGDPGTNVEIYDLDTGALLGLATMLERDGHICGGFSDYSPPNSLNSALISGHTLLAKSSDGSTDTTIVIGDPPEGTPTNTPTMTVSPTPTGSATPTPTNTPSAPFLDLLPVCGQGPTVQFTVFGINWPNEEPVTLFWNNVAQTTIPAGHGGFFQVTWQLTDIVDGTYPVEARSASNTFITTFTAPCPPPPNSTPTSTPTGTPIPPDLIVSPPELLSQQPIFSNRPVDFRVAITNTGSVAIDQLFFVDIYIDPASISNIRIPIEDSNGYAAVSGLGGGESAEIIIQAPNGFPNLPRIHQVYSMVDSVEQIIETNEINNIAGPIEIDYVTPGPDPIWTPVYPDDSNKTISGVVRVLLRDWVPIQRIQVRLIDQNGVVVTTTTTDRNGYYEFRGLQPATFTITTCVTIDNISFSGSRAGIVAPDEFADIFMLPGLCAR